MMEMVKVVGHDFEVPVLVFQKMCLRNAHFYQLSESERWDDMESNLREMYMVMDYITVVAPLVHNDRNEKGHSWAMIARTYLIPTTSIRRVYDRVEEILAASGKINT